MNSKSSAILQKDAEYGDSYLDVHQTDRRFVRVSVKTYDNSGTYITVKLFKKNNDDYQFHQKITLTTSEFDGLAAKYRKIKSLAKLDRSDGKDEEEDEEAKPRPRKSRKLPEEGIDSCVIV